MAHKGKKPEKGKGSDGGFNVILGTKMSDDIQPETETKPEKAQEEKKPVPAEPVPAEPAPIPDESLSREDLEKKRQQLKNMLASLKDARSKSNMPTYSYHRTRKKYVAELSKIESLLSAKGGPQPAEGGKPGKPAGRAAGKAGEQAKGTAAGAPSGKQMEDLMRRVQQVESAHGMMPSFKSQLESLKSKMDEYQQVVDRLKSDEQELSRELPHMKRSLSALKGRVRKVSKGKGAAAGKTAPMDAGSMEMISRKVDTLAGKLAGTLDAMKKRIDQVSVVDELEAKAYAKDLKRDIRRVRSELANFLRKEDLTKLVLHPVVEGKGDAGKAPLPSKAKRGKSEIVPIGELAGRVGKKVTIGCSLNLLKSVRQRGMRMYWYRIEDPSGEGILTSGSEIKAKKARLSGRVRKTKTGSIYVEFGGLAR